MKIRKVKAKTKNQINPCAKVLSEIMKTCFLINEETDYNSHFWWSGHVNNINVYVTPKKADRANAVLSFEEYVNIPSSSYDWEIEFRTDTYNSVVEFSKKLTQFYELHMG